MRTPIPIHADKTDPRAGFSLIEIMVVVIIIGLLAAIAAPRLSGHSLHAEIRQTEANIDTIMMAIGLYEIAHGKYPSALEELVVDKPNEPGPFLEDEQVPTDAWGQNFKYYMKGKRAKVRSAGPDKIFDTEDDLINP